MAALLREEIIIHVSVALAPLGIVGGIAECQYWDLTIAPKTVTLHVIGSLNQMFRSGVSSNSYYSIIQICVVVKRWVDRVSLADTKDCHITGYRITEPDV
ncbi:hypothetical protein RRG08_050529 [Elysia crispata]|uniref:Uncharacterized protein n=1 Tax=Elysia crispata TaxID=231223 RepID=A0AAE1DM57_9GAST|nr:hypothetical protein RRG08_050529 [Elysia crispata]